MRDMALKERGRKSKSGMPLGVSPAGQGKFKVFFRSRRSPSYLGIFDTLEEAAEAALDKKREVNAASAPISSAPSDEPRAIQSLLPEGDSPASSSELQGGEWPAS